MCSMINHDRAWIACCGASGGVCREHARHLKNKVLNKSIFPSRSLEAWVRPLVGLSNPAHTSAHSPRFTGLLPLYIVHSNTLNHKICLTTPPYHVNGSCVMIDLLVICAGGLQLAGKRGDHYLR